jgi:CRP/FNR family transcriptional regulator, cyclic AMP receptor protein
MSSRSKAAGSIWGRLPAGKSITYKAGQTIFAQGDPCHSVNYISEGLVKLSLVSKRGRGAVLGIMGRGDFFGEGCIIQQATYLTSAVALAPSTICIISKRAMVNAIHDDREMAAAFVNYLVQRGARMQQELIGHLFNSSEKRLAQALLVLAEYGSQNGPEGAAYRISQDTLAEMIGTTRSRVNFFMNRFRKLGYIKYNGRLKVNKTLHAVLKD